MGRNGTTKQVPWYLFPLWGLLALGVLVVIWGLYGKARLCGQTAKARQAKRAVTHGCALALGQDLTRHHCFRYCNRRSLPPGYFRRAAASLSDGAVYLVLTQSNSPAGEVIGLVTDRTYNHVSLALDRDLHTLVSYNGGDGIAPPGLNPETLGGLLRRPGAAARLYRLPATRAQKQILLRRLGKIDQEGSAYNLLGLLVPYARQPNIMVCSQFVYRLLKLAGLGYFFKDPFRVRPTDFVELAPPGRLTFVGEIRAAARQDGLGEDPIPVLPPAGSSGRRNPPAAPAFPQQAIDIPGKVHYNIFDF